MIGQGAVVVVRPWLAPASNTRDRNYFPDMSYKVEAGNLVLSGLQGEGTQVIRSGYWSEVYKITEREKERIERGDRWFGYLVIVLMAMLGVVAYCIETYGPSLSTYPPG